MDPKKIKPLGDQVLVKRSLAETQKGGILLPDSAQNKPKRGLVVATGAGKRDESGQVTPLEVSSGDEVLFSSYAGTPIATNEGDDAYLLMSQTEIHAVLV